MKHWFIGNIAQTEDEIIIRVDVQYSLSDDRKN